MTVDLTMEYDDGTYNRLHIEFTRRWREIWHPLSLKLELERIPMGLPIDFHGLDEYYLVNLIDEFKAMAKYAQYNQSEFRVGHANHIVQKITIIILSIQSVLEYPAIYASIA